MTFYKYFPNKVELIRSIRDEWLEEGFKKFDEIKALAIPFPDKINLMTRWKVELASRINAEFIRDIISNDDAAELFKQRYLGNIRDAQMKGEIRSDINLEFLWMVLEKIGELFMEGNWKNVFSELSQYQHQIRTLIFYGLLTRKEEEK
jgi:AcrR family transcriptional regulator